VPGSIARTNGLSGVGPPPYELSSSVRPHGQSSRTSALVTWARASYARRVETAPARAEADLVFLVWLRILKIAATWRRKMPGILLHL
jgi:hypothetical protein